MLRYLYIARHSSGRDEKALNVDTLAFGDLSVLERAKGFEPSTLTLARLCSTPELRPLELIILI